MKFKINIKLVLFLINFFCTSLIVSFTVPTQDIDMCTPGSVLAQVSPSGGSGPFTYSLIAGPMFGQVSSFDTSSGGFEYSLNPYRGCEHGCVYCYARPTHEYLGFSAGLDFETKIMVKENAPELLRKEGPLAGGVHDGARADLRGDPV